MVKGEISLLCIIFEFSKDNVWRLILAEHSWAAYDCDTVYWSTFPLWFALPPACPPWPPPLPHTCTHHASSILSLLRLHHSSLFGLFLSSHIHPPSLIHHPFNGHSFSIPVIWDCVCKSISGDGCVRAAVCVHLAMYGDASWDLRLHGY